jgi:hypothetical protein
MGQAIASPSGTNWNSAQITSARMSEKADERPRSTMAAGITATIKDTIMVGITVAITATGKLHF